MAVCRLAILDFITGECNGGYDIADLDDCIAFANWQLDLGMPIGFDGQDWEQFIEWAVAHQPAPEPEKGKIMELEHTKRYCLCPGWVKALESEYKSRRLAELLEHYPKTCPYCKGELKRRLRKVEVYITIESELYDSTYGSGFFLSLKEFKQLLKEETC